MNKPRTVLIISALDFWSMGINKGSPALYRTLKGYASQGWRVLFITGTCAPPDSPHLESDIQVVRFDARWLKKAMQIKKIGYFAKILWWIYFQITAFIKAQRLRKQHGIDVVYGSTVYGVPVAKLLSMLWHVPVVSRFQGTNLGAYWMRNRFWKVRAWDEVLGLRIPTNLVIMTNDGTQGDAVLKQLGVDMSCVRFWMNGVDWTLFQNSPKKHEALQLLNVKDRYTLLTVSRLVSWKRVDRSIQALPNVIKDFPDTILIIVGDGPERENLEHIAQELGVSQHVRFEGAVPHREIPKYLAAADIFLSFYDWSNVGNPLLEAMMAGKCIVTLNNGDTSQFIKHNDNGILMEYDELATLPEVIKSLLADERLREQLGANARKFAQDHFWSWEERMQAEIRAVEALLA